MADRPDVFIGDSMQLDAKGVISNGEKVLRSSKMRFLLLQCEALRNNMLAYTQGINMGKAMIKQIDEELNQVL